MASGSEMDDSRSEYDDEVSVSEFEDEASGSEQEEDSDVAPSEDDEERVCVPEELRAAVAALINRDKCEKNCLQGKAKALEQFLTSLGYLSPQEKKANIMAVLATLISQTRDQVGDEERRRFSYCLPMVGVVCREFFCQAYGVSSPTIARYRARIESGTFHPEKHGNTGNQHAKVMDTDWLVKWFRGFATEVGEIVPVRVRRQQREGGRVVRTVTQENNLLLPSYFTWEKLHEEMLLHVAESMVRV